MSCNTVATVEARAVVLANTPGRVQLAVTRQSACHACAEKNQCGSKSEHTRAQRIWLASVNPLPLGQEVAVSLPENALLRAALLVYGTPLAGFVLGLLAGAAYGDRVAMLAAVAGLFCGFGASAFLTRRLITPLQLHPNSYRPPLSQGASRHD